jgi:zinc protease
MKTRVATLLSLLLPACAATTPKPVAPEPPKTTVEVAEAPAPPAREQPPASGTMRDLAFPAVEHITFDNGFVVDFVRTTQLPTVSMELVIQSGSAADPEALPGLAGVVADMLKEGTLKKNAGAFAEAVEFLGASIGTSAGSETVRVSMHALNEHFDAAMGLLAEAALTPAFDPKELEKLKKRSLDELKLKMDKPQWLARRELQRQLYGSHPYARYDTTEAALKKLTRKDLASYHGGHFAPNNAFLVVVGDITREALETRVKALFGAWKKKDLKEVAYPAPPAQAKRRILVIDRPASVQSQILIGNLAIKRNDPGYVKLMVANQVLGGSAASRLFMDLREKRSLTYGAYSRVDESVDVGTFRASAAVRTPVTGEAVQGFFEHLDRIVKEAPSADEVGAAQRFLADSFPLHIETADRVAELLGDVRVYGLPEHYWDGFRSEIRKVDGAQALEAARAHIHPEACVVVVVGRAAEVVPMLAPLGEVEVLDTHGAPILQSGVKPSATPASSAPTTAPQPSASAL